MSSKTDQVLWRRHRQLCQRLGIPHRDIVTYDEWGQRARGLWVDPRFIKDAVVEPYVRGVAEIWSRTVQDIIEELATSNIDWLPQGID